MCGIVGVAGPVKRDRLIRAVKAMNAAVAHRGPDDEGVWTGEDFAFGMRRLSIIDLSGGHQPMWDDRSATGIVYNGEIYNYRSLRAGLEKRGIHFQTTSDTEVALRSLVLKGADAVHDWNGMFALAAWNDREKKLLLIRDRMGIKPLYYYWDGLIFLFASEIKALLASNLFPRVVNRQAVWDYLTYQYVPGPETIWRNIWKLPPGYMLEWAPEEEPRLSRYWNTDVLSAEEPLNIDQRMKEFESLFLDSVEQRLLAADVPVGVMLSGGLDSSSVAAAAVELGHKQFHTFTVGFADGGDYSELGYARQVAKHLGVECHETVIDRTAFLEMLPQAVGAADEPLADQASVPLLAVSQLARQHVKVVLSGEGGDEIFAGYEFDVLHRKLQNIRQIQNLPRALSKPINGALALFSGSYAEKWSRAVSTPLSEWNLVHKHHMTRIWNNAEKPLLWPAFEGLNSDRILDIMYAETGSRNPLDQTLSVYQKSWLVEDLLMKADKMSMAASLELRVPFLDYRLVEWANRQPVGTRVGRYGGRYVTKHILRRFARKRLPREIIDRPKRGFPVPVYQWLRDDGFSRWVLEYTTGKNAKLKHLFEPGQMTQLVHRAAAGAPKTASRIWLLIVLEAWFREFDVQIEPEKPPQAATALALGSKII
jgi:asparagine synthase (glutamine-hydrolysing)